MDPAIRSPRGRPRTRLQPARPCLNATIKAVPAAAVPSPRTSSFTALSATVTGCHSPASSTCKRSNPTSKKPSTCSVPACRNGPLTIPLADLVDPRKTRRTDIVITQRNTPALFGDGLIDIVPDDVLIAHMREHMTAARLVGLNAPKIPNIKGRIARLADGRLGKFGWKLEFATLQEFVKAACANELGLSNPDRPQATPLGKLAYQAPGTDLTDAQCVLMTDFIRALPAPVQIMPTDPAVVASVKRGETLFKEIGCADCHVADLGPVAGIYSDNLMHDMGVQLQSSTGYYGCIIPEPQVANDKFAVSQQPTPGEWRTAPLWGVADSAPYLHDGRAASLEQAIELHGGEAVDVTKRFQEASPADRAAIVEFLKTIAPEANSRSDRGAR